MTAKRFTVKQRQGATNYSIEDYYGELPLHEGMYYKSNAEKLCKWLNEQHEENQDLHKKEVELGQNYLRLLEENEELKFQLKECREHKLFSRRELEKENEELKQFKQLVFNLIDKSLEKDKRDYEMTYGDYLNGRIEVLEELKKELKS